MEWKDKYINFMWNDGAPRHIDDELLFVDELVKDILQSEKQKIIERLRNLSSVIDIPEVVFTTLKEGG